MRCLPTAVTSLRDSCASVRGDGWSLLMRLSVHHASSRPICRTSGVSRPWRLFVPGCVRRERCQRRWRCRRLRTVRSAIGRSALLAMSTTTASASRATGLAASSRPRGADPDGHLDGATSPLRRPRDRGRKMRAHEALSGRARESPATACGARYGDRCLGCRNYRGRNTRWKASR